MNSFVSAVIITQNEDRVLARCLRSLTWTNEILVVDGGSTDRTSEICLDPTAPWAKQLRYLVNAWPGFRKQRDFALQQAAHPWVLVMDSDESCSPELAVRLQNLIKAGDPLKVFSPPAYSAYKVRRQEYFLKKPIFYGIWNPSYQDRFFLKEGVAYKNEVHEFPEFRSPPSRIEEPIFHDPDFNVERFLSKMNRYTSIEAKDRYHQGQRTNLFRIFFAFPAMFLKNYFYYRAYKDGYHGFVISLLEGLSRAVRHIKLWQLELSSKEGTTP